jgi:hypothetical protein
MTRRALLLSLAGAAVIVIVALAFLGGPVTLPPLISTGTSASTQASSQTTTAQGTGPVLEVAIRILRDPISLGTTQAVIVTVHDPGGGTVSNASVRVEVLYPSEQNVVSEGLTGTSGEYVYTWHIAVSAENVGTFQVTASATKAGYQLGQAQATFQATAG